MVMTWQENEDNCVNFLNDYYGDYFKLNGGCDSTSSDIYYSKDGVNFWIECKSTDSQAGQFVLFPNEECKYFEFSDSNKTKATMPSVKEIIDFMNVNFDQFKNPGRGGRVINLDQKLFANWIVAMYKNKGVKFVIVYEEFSKEYIIFPVERFSEYFNIECKYRIKRSGSRPFLPSHRNDFMQAIQKLGIEGELIAKDVFQSVFNLDRKRINGEFNTFFLKMVNDNLYKVRVLSKTMNSNVIFQIHLKCGQREEDLLEFKRYIIFTRY